MHASSGYPPSYFSHPGQVLPPGGQYRPPYPQMMHSGMGPSFQSMTSHWNISHAGPTPSPVATTTTSSSKSNKHQSNSAIPGLKPPKPPDKPLLPYMRYSRKMWEDLKRDGTDLKVWEVGKIIGQKWRELGEEEKQPFFDEYEAEKMVYEEQMKVYRNSTAYKNFLEAKKLAERQAAMAAAANAANVTQQQVYGLNQELAPPPPPAIIALPRHPDPRLTMLQQQQQQEEDDEDEYVTMKQIAATHFHRNHRLIQDIFNDSIVPDTRTVVTPTRLAALQKQAHSLALHQKKLQEEVHLLENKYTSKRARFLDDADRFRKELRRIHDNPPTSWKKPTVQLSTKDIPEQSGSGRYMKL